jgi:hypothetical protein
VVAVTGYSSTRDQISLGCCTLALTRSILHFVGHMGVYSVCGDKFAYCTLCPERIVQCIVVADHVYSSVYILSLVVYCLYGIVDTNTCSEADCGDPVYSCWLGIFIWWVKYFAAAQALRPILIASMVCRLVFWNIFYNYMPVNPPHPNSYWWKMFNFSAIHLLIVTQKSS